MPENIFENYLKRVGLVLYWSLSASVFSSCMIQYVAVRVLKEY